MACLGSVLYDPTSTSTHAASSLLAMTALDTTNARITFTVPTNGNVLVKLRACQKGSTVTAQILYGVLEATTVRGRQAPIISQRSASTAILRPSECTFLVTGLTPGANLTWDAAYAVQVLQANSLIGAGGPNDTVASNAYGALEFSVWETTNLLAGVMYDPAVAVSVAAATASVMAAFDTTNLRLTFTPPASGRVLVRLRATGAGITVSAPSTIHLGVLSGATVIGRQAAHAILTATGTVAATDLEVFQSEFVVDGLSGSQTWDAAFAVETIATGQTLKYGGPDNATGANAYGGFAYEVWAA